MRLSGFAARALLVLGLSACSTAAVALDEDFDAHLFVVESFLGSSFDLRQTDADANGILEEDQLGLLSVILEGGAITSELNPAMVTQILNGFNANLPKVEQELTVDIGSQGTVNLVDQLADTDPVLGNAMQKLIAGFMTMGDTVTVAYVNQIADQVIVQVLDGTPEEDSISSVQNQINFVASNFSVFGNAGSGSNFLGFQGDVDADTLSNLAEYSTAGGDREAWHTANQIDPPLRLKDLSGGGLAISGLPMDFSIETAGGGTPVTFQWRKGTVGSSTLLSTTPTFSIPFLNSSNGGKYFCTYTDGVRTRNSPSLNLTVTQLPIFISTPIIGATRTLGTSYTFNVSAQGGSPGPYSYVWKKGGTPIEGAPNTKSFQLTNLQVSDGGQYSVTVSSNGGGDGVTSGPVTLTVNSNVPPIVISQQPLSVARQEGASHTFSITVTGGTGNFNYEWRKSNVAIVGAANQSTFTVPNVTPLTVGSYSCFVSDAADASRNALSNTATLTITENPVFITQQPVGDTVALGEPVTLTIVAGGGSGNFNYDWRKNGVSLGAPNQSAYLIGGALSNDGGNYTCVVSDAAELTNTVESDAATLTVLPVFNLSITTQPQSVEKQLGQNHTFTISVNGGTGFYTYTWLKNGEPIGAQSQPSLLISGIEVSDAADYSCEVRDSFQTSLSVSSEVATLSLDLATLIITQQPQGATKALGQSHTFTVAATGGSGSYTYDWRKGDTSLGITTPSFTLTNLDTDDAGLYTCFVDDTQVAGDALTEVAVLVVLDAQPMVISQQPQGAFKYSGDQHTLRVTVTGGSGNYNFNWRKNGESLCGGDPLCNSSELTFGALATSDDGSYSVVVSDANFPDLTLTSLNVPLGVEDRIEIVRGPRGRTVLSGDVVVLEVEATGGFEPVSFEWQLDGQAIPGAIDAPVIELNPARLADGGEYTCIVSDGFADSQVTQGAFVNVELAELPETSTTFGPVNLSGALTVPASGSSSQGQVTGTLTNLGTKGGSGFSLNITLTQNIGLARGPVLSLHAGAPGVNGPLLFAMPFSPSVNFVDQTLQLTEEEASIVASGRAYLTIATTAFPNGELRTPLFPLVALINYHDGDIDKDFVFSLTELLRVIQLYNVDGYHCDEGSEDGFAPGTVVELENCQPHSADYNPSDVEWVISLSEVLRVIQFFNSENRAYFECIAGEDGFCAGVEIEP